MSCRFKDIHCPDEIGKLSKSVAVSAAYIVSCSADGEACNNTEDAIVHSCFIK